MKKLLYMLFLLASFSSYAQQVRIKLENCSIDSVTLLNIQNSLNFQLAFYANLFNDTTVSTFRARIFGTEKEYLKYSKDVAKFNPQKEDAIAFYDPDLKEMIMHKEIDDFEITFAHELNHSIFDYYCPDHGIWLTEGLSEFLEDVIFTDSKYYFGESQRKKISNAKFNFLDGAKVEDTIFSYDFYRDPDNKNYSISWAIIFYLYKTNSKLLDAIVRESCTLKDDWDLLNTMYPGGETLLQSDVQSFFINYNPMEIK